MVIVQICITDPFTEEDDMAVILVDDNVTPDYIQDLIFEYEGKDAKGAIEYLRKQGCKVRELPRVVYTRTCGMTATSVVE